MASASLLSCRGQQLPPMASTCIRQAGRSVETDRAREAGREREREGEKRQRAGARKAALNNIDHPHALDSKPQTKP